MTVHTRPEADGGNAADRAAGRGMAALRLVRGLPRWAWIVLAAFGALLLWYGVLGGMQARIAPDPALRPAAEHLPSGGSVAVAFAARLLDVEVNERAFTPNDRFYHPSAFARKAPAYQAAVVATVAAFVDALSARPESPELETAARFLQTPVDQRGLQLGWPMIQPSAERDYRRAIAALVAHNAGLSASHRAQPQGQAAERLPPYARGALAALADALDAQAMRTDAVLAGRSDAAARAEFSAARGAAHAAAMLVRGLRDDHAAAIRLSGRAACWGETLDHLDRAAASSPLFVGDNDLTRSGYQLLMASAAIRRILE